MNYEVKVLLMTTPQFIFTKYSNSFSVYIKNLEQLSVEQIQEIQIFVAQRKGVFDFETYSFVIQKRLEFDAFVSLLGYSEINAECEEVELIRKTYAKIDFGKYKGMRFSELPDSYLIWLKGNYRGKERETIDTELKSRNI